jgi:hypothetical protein
MGEGLLESVDCSTILFQRMESRPADVLNLEGILTILIQHVRFGSILSSTFRFILREFDPR